ncbi:MAG: hypothetical protein K2O69_02060 [Odoribacter sp.]|nr:hypothetical protein [Odoribacter sp.]
MRIVVILLALSVAMMFSSCKKKKKAPKLVEKKVEVVEVPKPAPEPEPTIVREEPKPVRQANYHLVAGCFRIKKNAERLHEKLLREGYNSQMLPFYHLTMVTYDSYETRAEAQVALNRIVREPGKRSTWVYPVK